MTRVFMVLGAVWALGAAAGLTPPATAADDRSSYAKACHHYENRARFRVRGTGDFIATLADSCVAARRSLGHGPTEAVAAVAFLDRVVELFDTVSRMNFERVYGETTNPFAKPLAAHGEFVPLGRVTETGEFLIAHRMGLISAYDSWRDVAGEVALAPAE